MCSVLLLVDIEENRYPIRLLTDGQSRLEGVFAGFDGFALLTDWVRDHGLENAYVRLRAKNAAAISQALILAVFFDRQGWTVGLDAPLSSGKKMYGRQGRRRPSVKPRIREVQEIDDDTDHGGAVAQGVRHPGGGRQHFVPARGR